MTVKVFALGFNETVLNVSSLRMTTATALKYNLHHIEKRALCPQQNLKLHGERGSVLVFPLPTLKSASVKDSNAF